MQRRHADGKRGVSVGRSIEYPGSGKPRRGFHLRPTVLIEFRVSYRCAFAYDESQDLEGC